MRFEYELSGPGWATATITDSDQTLEFNVSYLTDAPRILIDRLLYIADGGRIVLAVWARDPGDFVWYLVVGEQNELAVQVWEFSGAEEDGSSSFRGSPMEGSAGVLRFDVRSTVSEFASAVAEGFRACISRTGVSEYRQQWDAHEFPMSMLDALERWTTTTSPGYSALPT